MTVPRAQPIGSLLRPDAVKRAREDAAAGAITPAELKRAEDAAVDAALAAQAAAGLDVATDGEMRRGHFTGALSEAVDGLTEVPAAAQDWYGRHPEDRLRYTHGRAVTGRLRRRRSLAQEEWVYARAAARGLGVALKQTLPSPLMMQTYWSPDLSTDAYADPFDMFADAAALLRDEVRDLVALGCPYVQIDAPELALLVDPAVRESFVARGIDPDRMLTEGVELIASVVDVPGAAYGLHLCRGNREGHWLATGGYAEIASAVFRRAGAFGTFLLEYDDARSGGFEPLADVPDDTAVVLGLVSTKRPGLEDEDELLARIDDASRHHPRDLLALSPQCGFASTLAGNPLTPEDQAAKLALVGRVARRAWPA
ncbi:MAG TPA: cobalamin-independent methionine synthase II family protein [Streptosporangiaceae bacterium]|jgi:5-methyltetrahydropteroyltriglutamate--homocysteine methyltransferase